MLIVLKDWLLLHIFHPQWLILLMKAWIEAVRLWLLHHSIHLRRWVHHHLLRRILKDLLAVAMNHLSVVGWLPILKLLVPISNSQLLVLLEVWIWKHRACVDHHRHGRHWGRHLLDRDKERLWRLLNLSLKALLRVLRSSGMRRRPPAILS